MACYSRNRLLCPHEYGKAPDMPLLSSSGLRTAPYPLTLRHLDLLYLRRSRLSIVLRSLSAPCAIRERFARSRLVYVYPASIRLPRTFKHQGPHHCSMLLHHHALYLGRILSFPGSKITVAYFQRSSQHFSDNHDVIRSRLCEHPVAHQASNYGAHAPE